MFGKFIEALGMNLTAPDNWYDYIEEEVEVNYDDMIKDVNVQ